MANTLGPLPTWIYREAIATFYRNMLLSYEFRTGKFTDAPEQERQRILAMSDADILALNDRLVDAFAEDERQRFATAPDTY